MTALLKRKDSKPRTYCRWWKHQWVQVDSILFGETVWYACAVCSKEQKVSYC